MSARLVLASVLVAAVAGCGSDPLANLGGRSNRFFGSGSETTVSAAPSSTIAFQPVEELQGVGEVVWSNRDDSIWGSQGLETLEPAQIVSVIWDQSSERDAFVQASPAEIAASLPGIGFPRLIPSSVRYVSSQLIFDPQTGELSEELQTAFGLWAVEPYTQSREAAQRAVVLGGPANQVISYQDGQDGQPVCPELGIEDAVSCRPVPIGTLVGWWHGVPDGGRLVWLDGPYRYDLFLRATTEYEIAVRMAESMEVLDRLLS
ncbi:MAG TPA: hypothetical protein VIL12_02880 [Acidimicrobiia bacterium]